MSDERQLEGSNGEDYNPVFEQLVDEADDGESTLVGLVAYGLYKSAKREWILSHIDENGEPPSADDLLKYAKMQTDTALNGYRAQANEILASFADSFMQAERPRILTDALRGGFWRAFWPSLLASFAFAATILILVGIAALQGTDFPVSFGSVEPGPPETPN